MRPPLDGRIAYLDGIRTVAILAVIASHWGFSYLGIFRGGYIGVDIFFVLSGYIITKIVWRKRESMTYGGFIFGRLRRLYPALLGVVIITWILAYLLGSLSVKQTSLAAMLAVLQVNSIVEGLHLASTIPFGVTWSLSAEWMFYLLWPLVIIFVRRIGAKELAITAACGSAAFYLASIATTPEWFYYGPVSRGAQLLAGAALALALTVWSPKDGARAILRYAAPTSVALIVIYVTFGPDHFSDLYRQVGFPLATVAGMTLVLSGLVDRTGLVARGLALPWMAAIGRGSYSLYLWHVIPVMLLDKDLIPLPNWALGAIGVVSAAILSWLSYLFLEKPFLQSQKSSIASTIPSRQP